MTWCAAVAQAVQSLLGGAVPGKAACGGLVPPLLIVAAAWYGLFGSELGKVGPVGTRELTTLEPRGELLAGGDVPLVSTGRGDQPAEDASLGHLQSLGHRRNTSQTGWKSSWFSTYRKSQSVSVTFSMISLPCAEQH